MTPTQIETITRQLKTMALLNKTATEGAVTAKCIDYRRQKGQATTRYRVDWFINGNRVTRKDAAKFLAT